MIKKIKEYRGIVKNKKNKILIYLLNLLLILNIAAGIYFIYSLLLLSGIETVIRIGIIVFAIIMMLIFGYSMINTVVKGKIKRYILFIVFILISISAQSFVAYSINKVHGSLSTINKNMITYTTSLIVLSDSEIEDVKDIKDAKIGIINKDKGLEDYTISKEIIKENKLSKNNNVEEYDDYFEMLNDLYNKEIDCAFVSSNYAIMFGTYEKFANIKNDVKEITSKSKDFQKSSTTTTVNKNIVKEPFTVLLMGVDSETEGLDKNAAFNGDSLMLITFNPNTLNTTVLSIPRDTYVPIMCFKNQKKNKITHAAWYGVDCMERTIENFTDIEIDYYVKMNFKGVVSLVDALGGIDVDVPFSFCEQNSDRAWGDSTICIEKGQRHLGGEQALALARHRKYLALGDIQRGLNQQIVIEGMLAKISSIDSIDKVNNILNTVSKNMDTNFTTNEILSFYNVAKDILLRSISTNNDDLIGMQKLYLDGYTKMIYDESFGTNLSNYVYYKSSLEAVSNAMKINLELEEQELEKSFNFSINEIYEPKVIGQGETDSISTISTLPNFIGSSKSYVSSWCNARNINANFVTIDENDPDYMSSYGENQVVTQSISQGTEIDKIKSITFKVIGKKEETDKEDTKTDDKKDTTSESKEITINASKTTIYLSVGEKKYNPAGVTIKEGNKDVTYSEDTYICTVGPYNEIGTYEVPCKVSYKDESKTYNLTIIVSAVDGEITDDTTTDTEEDDTYEEDTQKKEEDVTESTNNSTQDTSR